VAPGDASASDAADTFTATVSVVHGTLAVGAHGSATLTTSNGGATVTLTGSLSDVNTGLGNVTYTPNDFIGTDTLTLSATSTDGASVSAATSNSITISVNSIAEGPILGGATSRVAFISHAVTLGATDTVVDGDDTLGNVTITGLPTNLTGFNGGTYSGSSWTGTAAQFNALSFTTGTTTGTFTLSISATTTGLEAATTTGSYVLTVKPQNVLLSGNEMNSTIQSDLSAYGITSTIVSSSQLQFTDFSQYTGIWLSWATTYDNSSGQLASKFSNFINAGGNVLAEEGGGTNELSFLPNGSSVSTTGGSGDTVQIINSFGSLMNSVTGAGLSNWSSSYHDTYGSIGPFTGIADDQLGRWLTIGESLGQGNLVITGQDPSFHIKSGAGATGPGSPKAQFAVNALSLGPNHTDPPVGTVTDVAYNGATVDLISDDGSPLLELGPNATDNVAFDPDSPDGVLQLDSATTFAGQVALFAPGNTIDLRDIAFGASTSLGYSGNTDGGTLTATDGANSANIALIGNYMATAFATASDGHGGTAVTIAGTSATQDPLLTTPHP
jgi:hypothetical protein